MILHNRVVLISIGSRVPTEVDFLHRSHRIVAPEDQEGPQSVSDLTDQPALSVSHHHQLPDVLGEQVREDVEVSQESETEQYLADGDDKLSQTQRVCLATVEPESQTGQQAEDQHTGQHPVATVPAAQVEVERHLKVVDVGHHTCTTQHLLCLTRANGQQTY